MPLITDKGFVEDHWLRVAEDEPVPAEGDRIVPFSRLNAARLVRGNGQLGIHIDNDTSVSALEGLFEELDLISIDFPSFADGRGFSLAKRLRDRGYRGALRAAGPLVSDQYGHALACGFDSVEIPEDLAARQGEQDWIAAAKTFSATYQDGYHAPRTSILRARHAGA